MSTSANKLKRRTKKYQNIVLHDFGVECSSSSTVNLMVCNVGLVNGVGQEDIVECFNQFGELNDVVMIENKSYCFINYKTLKDAETCYNKANGVINSPKSNGVLYLLYVNSIPQITPIRINFIPEGLYVLENFVSEPEESELLNCVDFSQQEGQVLKHRQVKHFGYEFIYGKNNVDRNKPLGDGIPSECAFLRDRCVSLGYGNVVRWEPDQLTVNRYSPGHGIPSHVDTHSAFEDPILSLSLGSDIVMEFKNGKGVHVPILLPRRSLLIMSGEARYAWYHGITPRKIDVHRTNSGINIIKRQLRTSFTFRRVRCTPCDCAYTDYCDSRCSVKDEIIPDSIAAKLEQLYVRHVYEDISSHFSETRHKPWPNVLQFVNSLCPGSILLDIGCGNGKYFGHNNTIFEVGGDQCQNLAEICHSRKFEAILLNCLDLPLRSNSVDAAISIAVIHHLANEQRRLQALQEIHRVLRPGGRALIYVWAKSQVKEDCPSTYLKQDRKNRKIKPSEVGGITSQETAFVETPVEVALPVHANRTDFQYKDLLVPWKLKPSKDKINTESPSTFLRFYHVFEEHELDNLASNLLSTKINKSYYDQGNWCIEFEKKIIN